MAARKIEQNCDSPSTPHCVRELKTHNTCCNVYTGLNGTPFVTLQKMRSHKSCWLEKHSVIVGPIHEGIPTDQWCFHAMHGVAISFATVYAARNFSLSTKPVCSRRLQPPKKRHTNKKYRCALHNGVSVSTRAQGALPPWCISSVLSRCTLICDGTVPSFIRPKPTRVSWFKMALKKTWTLQQRYGLFLSVAIHQSTSRELCSSLLSHHCNTLRWDSLLYRCRLHSKAVTTYGIAGPDWKIRGFYLSPFHLLLNFWHVKPGFEKYSDHSCKIFQHLCMVVLTAET